MLPTLVRPAMSSPKRRFSPSQILARRSRDATNHPSTSLGALKTTLEVFQASVPLPGLRDALGGLLVIVNTAEVSGFRLTDLVHSSQVP